MNLPVSRTLFPFISLFFLFACDDPTDIGLELQDKVNPISTEYTDDLAVNASTILLQDSIVAFGAQPVLAGRLTDGDFGTITARTFAEVSLPPNTTTFEANNGADSLILSLNYAYYYGDTTTAMTLNVYELEEKFEEKQTYFTTSEMRTKSDLLGSATFLPRPSGKRPADVPAAQFTNPVKIKLSPELANRILAQSGKPALTNQQEFVAQLLKGIAIEPAPGSPAVAVLGFNLQSDSSYLSLHYTSGTTKKQVKFPFYAQQPRFNQITADRSGTPLAGLVNSGDLIPAEATGNVTYLQSGTGLSTKITFPDLAALKSKGNIAINQAELVVPVVRGLFDQSFLPVQVFLYETNQTNRILTYGDGTMPRRVQQDGAPLIPSGTDQPAELTYNEKTKEYTVNMTSYVQAMLYGGKPNDGLIISSNVNGNLINRAMLNASSTERIRLRIYYSAVN